MPAASAEDASSASALVSASQLETPGTSVEGVQATQPPATAGGIKLTFDPSWHDLSAELVCRCPKAFRPTHK